MRFQGLGKAAERGPRGLERLERGSRAMGRLERGPRALGRLERGPRAVITLERGPSALVRLERGLRALGRLEQGPRTLVSLRSFLDFFPNHWQGLLPSAVSSPLLEIYRLTSIYNGELTDAFDYYICCCMFYEPFIESKPCQTRHGYHPHRTLFNQNRKRLRVPRNDLFSVQ